MKKVSLDKRLRRKKTGSLILTLRRNEAALITYQLTRDPSLYPSLEKYWQKRIAKELKHRQPK